MGYSTREEDPWDENLGMLLSEALSSPPRTPGHTPLQLGPQHPGHYRTNRLGALRGVHGAALGQAPTFHGTMAASALPAAHFSVARVLDTGPQNPSSLWIDFGGQRTWVGKNQIIFSDL